MCHRLADVISKKKKKRNQNPPKPYGKQKEGASRQIHIDCLHFSVSSCLEGYCCSLSKNAKLPISAAACSTIFLVETFIQVDWLCAGLGSTLGGGSGPPFLHGDPMARLPMGVPLPCSPQPREGSVVPKLPWEGWVPFCPQDEQ